MVPRDAVRANSVLENSVLISCLHVDAEVKSASTIGVYLIVLDSGVGDDTHVYAFINTLAICNYDVISDQETRDIEQENTII